MAFGPFGFLWRRAGAFFLRKSFADPLYKEVFRTYVSYLIKEGFTQEFFIGGRPVAHRQDAAAALGVLSWDVERSWPAAGAICCSCRSRSRTSGWSKRARWSASSRRREGRREHARPRAGVALLQRRFGFGVRELRRSAVARRRDRRPARGALGRRRGGGRGAPCFVELLGLQSWSR